MIKAINYNWYASVENGEEFTNRTVGLVYGNLKCDKIEQHAAAGEGDKWYYDIHYSDGTKERIFNPNQVFFDSTHK
jgi:hypothetical protein